MIRFTVIGGYLGTGKTPLLNHLLKNNERRRIALIVNDFGEINIDAGLIESQTESQINLTNGCVCCTLSDGFHESIDQLCQLDPAPDHIIVEASGVANVHNLAQYGYGPNMMLDGVLVLADAETVIEKAKDKYVSKTVQRQLAAADLIILNKIDLVSPSKLQEVKEWLASQYPEIPVVESEKSIVPMSFLLGLRDSHSSLNRPPDQLHEHNEQYDTWQYQSSRPTTTDAVQFFLDGLGSDIIRAKGFALLEDGSALVIQVVGNRKEISNSTSDHNDGLQLIAIGLEAKLDKAELDRLAEETFGS